MNYQSYGVTREQILSVLHQAKDAIDRHGWTRLDYVNRDTGCLCVSGAIKLATGGWIVVGTPGGLYMDQTAAHNLFADLAEDAAWRVLGNVVKSKQLYNVATGVQIQTPIQYNDYVAKSKQDILDLLDEAITEVESQ